MSFDKNTKKAIEFGFKNLTPSQEVLFLNIPTPPSAVKSTHNFCSAYKSQHNAWAPSGCKPIDFYSVQECFPSVVLFMPKQKGEAAYMLSKALYHLEENGHFCIIAHNKGGAGRLDKSMDELNLTHVEMLSKAHCKIAVGQKTKDFDTDKALQIMHNNNFHLNEDGYWSVPGLFSWDHTDRGSQILAQYFDDNLKGIGADFGCGTGVLTKEALGKSEKIAKIYAIDNDCRAIRAVESNVEDERVHTLWEDLTQKPKFDHPLNFVIMNPPFHEGKAQKASLGQSMIDTAFMSLKPHGHLLMVANAHLPYEKLMQKKFKKVDILETKNGFKVIRARK